MKKDLKKELEAELLKKRQDCEKELKEVLSKHNCDISCQMVVTAQGNFPQFLIINKK